MKTPLTAAAIAIATLVIFSPVAATTTIVPTTSPGDGYHHDELGSSYDYFDSTSASLSVLYTFYGTSDTVNNNKAYLQFSLASIPTDVEFQSIVLHLYLTERHYADESPSAGFVRHRTNSTGATGLASQRYEGDFLLLEVKDQPIGSLFIDVTTRVQNDLAMGYAYSTFSLNPNTSGYFRNAGFTVTASDAGINGPFLAFTIPEPSAAAALTIGFLAVLIALRRRS